jgi:hypothetical protein
MTNKKLPCEAAAAAQIKAALALRRTQLLVATYCPPSRDRHELLIALRWLIESVTPIGGGHPTLRFTRPATPASARETGRKPAGE